MEAVSYLPIFGVYRMYDKRVKVKALVAVVSNKFFDRPRFFSRCCDTALWKFKVCRVLGMIALEFLIFGFYVSLYHVSTSEILVWFTGTTCTTCIRSGTRYHMEISEIEIGEIIRYQKFKNLIRKN